MILIAESGSTKTEWRLCDQGKVLDSFRCEGANPNIQSSDTILQTFSQAFQQHLTDAASITNLHFYGAGLKGKSERQVIYDVLVQLLPNAMIAVEHDMLAAARSGNRPEGIVCILGTGSNSCYHKDYQIVENLGGHGFIFGDEGGGVDLGKHLIKGALQGDFPSEVNAMMEAERGMKVFEQKLSVYHSEKPNVQMASYSLIIDKLIHIPEIRAMVKDRFLAFLDTTVCRYENYQDIPTDFVGSVSFFYQAILREACNERGVMMKNVTKDPIDQLVVFHGER